MSHRSSRVRFIGLVLGLSALTACSPKLSMQEMAAQPRFEVYEPSAFFSDGASARPLETGTVPRGGQQADALFYTGQLNGQPAEMFPFPITHEVLSRGQERFDIYCAPCHGRTGNGDGLVVRRGFTAPPSYHIDRLRQAPVGHFFDVITNGFGAMSSYAEQIAVRDRWAIIAYIRALQLSQHAALSDVPADQRGQLQGGGQP